MEPFIYLALFFLVAVASLAFRWLRAQIEVAPSEPIEAEPWTSPHRPVKVASASPTTVPKETRDLARHAPPVQRSPLPRRHPAHLAAGGSVKDLRRGILWMTILGRCRGLEPPRRIADTGTPLDDPY